MSFILKVQCWFNIFKPIEVIHDINWLNKKDHMIISPMQRKHLTEFHIHSRKKKTSQKTRDRRKLLSSAWKDISPEPTVNILKVRD